MQLQPHITGDTFDGQQITIKINNIASDLTDAIVNANFHKESPETPAVKTLTNGQGITIIDAIGGVFQIDKQIIDLPPAYYYLIIKIKYANGDIKTYIQATLPITY